MKNLERFVGGRAGRTLRSGKTIYTIIKYGSKGVAKVNPVMVVFDAAISVIDCGIEYFKYKKEKEKHKILLNKLESIKFEYETKRKIIEKELNNYRVDINLLSDNLLDEIKKEREKLQKYQETILLCKDGLIFLKEIYLESNDSEKLEEIISIQSAFIELLIK